MSKIDNITQPRLRNVLEDIEIKRDKFFDTYTGTKDDLIQSGLATADMFPARPKRKSHSLWRVGGGPKNKEWQILRRGGSKFELIRFHEERKPEDPPLTVTGYREHLKFHMRMLDVTADIVNGNILTNNPDGYHLAAADEVSRCINKIKNILLNGGIVKKQSKDKKFSVIKGGIT